MYDFEKLDELVVGYRFEKPLKNSSGFFFFFFFFVARSHQNLRMLGKNPTNRCKIESYWICEVTSKKETPFFPSQS